MIVYHGSYTEIDKVDLSMSMPHKDFGKGFYVTKLREQAETWAARIGEDHNCDGVVTEFVFYESVFSNAVFHTLRFERYDDKWLDFVVLNRRRDSPVPAHDYDIVEGPVADDRISQEITQYINGKISREKFLNMLRHERPTHQICFCTADSLLMIDRKEDSSNIDYEISEVGDKITGQLFLDLDLKEIKAADLFFSSKTFGKLADAKTKLYLKPWQEIYKMLKEELNL